MLIPPYKIKSVESIKIIPRAEREKKLREAGFNPFLLKARDVYIDLLTDSGTGAMSQEQWAGMMLGDESYAGAKSFERMKKSIKEIMGFDYILPTHQGRAAEHVLDAILVKNGDIVPGNKHFDTTKAHIEWAKGKTIDVTISEADNSSEYHPFKGNLDIKKLEKIIAENKKNISYLLITITCNSVGGQPVSLANIKAVSTLAKKNKLLLFFDAARYAENAYFIKTREKNCAQKTIKEIIKEMMGCVDGVLMSAKKDAIVNMGGFIAVRSKTLYQKLVPISILFEGFTSYGGMSGHDIEALAQGLYEGIEENYLAYRVGQVAYLGKELKKRGVPVIEPFGGHAVYIDAKKFLPRIPQEQFPGHSLCCEIYLEGGIRAVEIGTLLAGRDPETKRNIYPALELVRLTIPRRVYFQEHIDYVISVIEKVWQKRDKIKGLKLVYEPPILRHFQARLEPIKHH